MNPISINHVSNPYNYNSPYMNREYSPYVSAQEPVQEDSSKTLGLLGLLQFVALGLQKASGWFSTKLAAGKEFTSSENVKKVADEMIRKNKLDVNVGYINDVNKHKYADIFGNLGEFETVARGQNAFFADKLKLAVAPESKPSLILHELGHAVNAKGFFTKLLQNSRRYAPFAPTALLFANSIFANKKKGEKTFIERNAGILGFVAFLPTIIEEGIASSRGIKAAKKVLNNPSTLNILKKNYALALCTYILAGIGLGVAAKQTVIYNTPEHR